MDRERFDAIVHETIGALPAWVHEALENIETLVVDRPEEELDPEADDLLGLHTGTALRKRQHTVYKRYFKNPLPATSFGIETSRE